MLGAKVWVHEAQQLKNVSGRLELLADEKPAVTDAILTICGTIRSTATILEVLVATKLDGVQRIGLVVYPIEQLLLSGLVYVKQNLLSKGARRPYVKVLTSSTS